MVSPNCVNTFLFRPNGKDLELETTSEVTSADISIYDPQSTDGTKRRRVNLKIHKITLGNQLRNRYMSKSMKTRRSLQFFF